MKTYKCLKTFPNFVNLIDNKVIEFPGRKENEIFNVMDMKSKAYTLLLKHNFIKEVIQ
jgi:hypothetical protein